MDDESDWLPCGEALALARNLSGTFDIPPVRGHPTHVTLFHFVADRKIRVKAKRTSHSRRKLFSWSESPTDLGLMVQLLALAEKNPIAQKVGKGWFTEEPLDIDVYDTFSGIFVFGGGDADEKLATIGLKLSRSDIVGLFGNFLEEIAPNPAGLSTPVESKAGAEKECERWISQKFSEGSALTKTQFMAAALVKFNDRLSGHGFKRAWAVAVREFPERSKAGRKSNRRIDSPV